MTWTKDLRRATGAWIGSCAIAAGLIALPAAPAQAATVGIDLYAVTGSTTLPNGATLPVLGYSLDGSAVTAPGGPTLVVNEGDDVTITLHNSIGERTGLLVQGQAMTLDSTGVAAGGTTTYSFTADRAGTFLYEAGPFYGATVPHGTEHQTAMGLHGAFVVRPATAGQAYNDPATAYDDEAVLVLSEIDPALNGSTSPADFDMRAFNPRFFLVNGLAYPDTAAIPSAGGNTLLLRYVNAGVNYHSMGVLGARQSVVAMDGSLLTYPRSYVAQTFGPGETADALVTVPGSPTDTSLTIYDASWMLHNSNPTGPDADRTLGGMLTTVDVTGTASPGDTTGPVTSAVAFDPGTSTLSAHASDVGRGGSTVTSVEYFVDDVSGSATALTGLNGTTETDASGTFTLDPGQHVVYVRAGDAAGNTGPFTSLLLTGADTSAPTTSGITLRRNIARHGGTRDVLVSATADDSASGNNNIVAAEYFIDPDLGTLTNGSGVVMDVSQTAPIASLDAAIPASVLDTLAEGVHGVYVHAQDAADVWGVLDATSEFATLVVDTTAPTVGSVVIEPDPTNGVVAYPDGQSSVRLTATGLEDPVSSGVNTWIAKAEAFIDPDPANLPAPGTGIPLSPSDGTWNDYQENADLNIPLSTIRALSSGEHTIAVRARDAVGNWGELLSATFVVDLAGPTVTTVSVTPNPTVGAATVTLDATGTDDLTGVVAAEYFVGANPGAGNGTAMTLSGTGPWNATAQVDVTGLSEGAHQVKVRMQDAAGNWGPASAVTLDVSAAMALSTLGNARLFGGTVTDNADLVPWSGDAFGTRWDATANGVPETANVDGMDVDGTDTYLSFTDTVVIAGFGRVQDEDVVLWDGSTWSLFFDGSAHGMARSPKLDIDGLSVSNGVLFFSTKGNAKPAGVRGKADNADIYAWNGSRFRRVWDATKHGVPATANVDGYSRVNAKRFYVSFAATSTRIRHLGKVQDEDVVAFSGSSRSVYFNGTKHGMGTSGSKDIDALDVD